MRQTLGLACGGTVFEATIPSEAFPTPRLLVGLSQFFNSSLELVLSPTLLAPWVCWVLGSEQSRGTERGVPHIVPLTLKETRSVRVDEDGR